MSRARVAGGRSLVRAPGSHYLLELVQVVLLDALPRGALVQAQLLLQSLQGGGAPGDAELLTRPISRAGRG